MSGFNYLINLQVLNGSAFSKLSSAAGSFETALESAQGEVHDTSRAVKKLGDDGRRSFDGMAGSVRSWIAGLGIGLATLGSLNTAVDTKSLETAIVFAGGKDGAANLAYVYDSVDRLKTPIQSALSGFRTLEGSMMGTNITADQTRKIYDSVAVASRVMGLSADNTTGALLALGQMASKGKVQAEELRGQLGERIPGAFAIAARAMKVSNAQLDKMLNNGQVIAEDFLPKFAAEMMKTFSPGLEAAIDGPRARLDAFQNAAHRLKVQIGTGLLPVATALVNILIPFFKLIGDNLQPIGLFVTVLGSLYAAAKLYAVGTAVASLVTGGFTGTIWGLNAAMLANPITWVVGAVVALAGAFTYAWNTSDNLRAGLKGLWAQVTTFASLIYDRFVNPVIGAFQVLRGAWNNDLEQMKEGMDSLKGSVKSWGKDMGSELDTAYNKAWNESQGMAFDLIDPKSQAYKDALKKPFGGADFGNKNTPGGNKPAGQAKDIANGITGGGQRNVTINVGKLIESFSVNTTNMKEGAQRAGDEVLKQLLQALNQANQVQTN